MGRLLRKMENDGVFSLWLLGMQVDTSQRSLTQHNTTSTPLSFASLCYNGIGGIVT